MKKLLIVLLCTVFLSACGEKRIDTSTKESFQQSILAVANDLNTEDKTAFEHALTKLGFEASAYAKGSQIQRYQFLTEKLNNKTAMEVIELYGVKE
ncbi:DUF6694 family lipoprotein [Zophobihabitans entericus]|uniref:Uncharacterized protein n=1 Tax=Zophobihabitans entericus TaxID=1635327 RepID=A0A6G9IA35_9GAMM|nr:DUF6694 family lipoprotein [Zophobihabitans entericus]QIQ20692.1 hypothetical protein IPMB12_02750 [Zophobihabitans entericus]